MGYDIDTYNKLLSENDELRLQLEEANDTIQAIRSGQVDALIVQGENGHQLYTLKTADQTYRVFIEKMNEGAVTLNRDGLILYSNSKFATMIGMPLEKVLGLSFEKFIPAGLVQNFTEIISNGWEEDYKEEITLLSKAGKEIPCLLSCNTLEMDEGIALSLILTDLSIQKEAEKQLKTKNEELEVAHQATEKLNNELEDTVKARTNELLISREHLRLLANNIPQMTWTSLPDGKANFYNQQWYDYTQLDDFETKEAAWRAVVHPDDLENTIEKYYASLASGNIFEVENRYKKGSDGSYRWHLNRAIPLKNEVGEIILWVGTATDIEDQKQQMERKDEFIGIASHELKTPLTSLKGYLQLIAYKKDELPEIVKTYITKANISISKLQYLINDLLDVSKIQAGRLEYQLEKMDITALINTCIESAEHIYPEYTFEKKAYQSFLINGNADRLEQVIMNLINNAVKYSPENKNIIVAVTQSDNAVRVSITDFGIGLSSEQIERIFERFYRVEDKKYMAGGLGMGLYISTEIINTHHGKIGVCSEPKKGSTFYFDLPLADV